MEYKYNSIAGFPNYIIASGLAESTAETYSKSVSWLLKEQNILDCRKMNLEMVLTKLKSIKHKNAFSIHKNAFLKFCKYIDLELDKDIVSIIENMKDQKKKKYRKLKTIYLDDVENRINRIRDKNLKLSFQVILNTGLRVFEVSQLKKEDCFINDDSIEFHFIGKGGNKEKVIFNKTQGERLFKNLLEHIKTIKENEKLFYSKQYLESKALKKGFKCHDLRRFFAKMEYQTHKDINEVKQRMRHKSIKNTKIYLKSKVKI